MKKIVLTMIAAVAMSFNAMAQEQNDQQRREFNPEEMAKNRTEAAVKKYGLNEEQAAKLLDLNKRFSDKMRPMRNMRQGRPNGNRERRMERPDSVRREAGQRPDMRGRMEEMRKVQDEYNKELKTILTEEQYQAYEKDEQARRQRFGGQRGQRPPMQRQ